MDNDLTWYANNIPEFVQKALAACKDESDVTAVIANIFETIHQEMVSRDWDKSMTYTHGTIAGWLKEAEGWEKLTTT